MSANVGLAPKANLFATVLSDLPNPGGEECSIENGMNLTHAVVGALKTRQFSSGEESNIVKALIGWFGRGPGDKTANEERGRSLYDSWSQRNDITLGWPYIRGLVEKAKLEYLLRVLDDPKQRPLVKVFSGQESQIVTIAEKILIQSGLDIYQRGGVLVKPGIDELDASDGGKVKVTSFHKLCTFAIKDHMGRAAHWAKMDQRGGKFVSVDPEKNFADILLSRRAEWSFPRILGIISAPTLRPDGSVLSTPGYDAQTLLYNASHGVEVLPMVENAARADAEEALKLLRDLIREFPFVSEVDRAVALSALITPVVRPSLRTAPLHAFRASTAGSGKSYLCDTISAIAIGVFCPAVSTGTDRREFEACLNGALLAGHSLFCLDNVNGKLGGDLLCRALTQPILDLRGLGSSDMHRIETRSTILANGNAITVVGDAIRRVLMSNLDPQMERPELRTFERKPFAMVIENRSVYVSACLTVVRAYILAGRPGCLEPKLGSFEHWSDNVRSALVWLGCADPVLSLDQAREDDPDLGNLRNVLALWPESLRDKKGVTVSNMVDAANLRIKEENGFNEKLVNPEWRDCLLRVAPGKAGGIDSSELGKWLSDSKTRIVSNRRIVKGEGKASGGATRWVLETEVQEAA